MLLVTTTTSRQTHNNKRLSIPEKNHTLRLTNDKCAVSVLGKHILISLETCRFPGNETMSVCESSSIN